MKFDRPPESKQEKEPKLIDLFSPELEEIFKTKGELFSRKTEPLFRVEQVTSQQVVETLLIDGTLETKVVAKPGDWIITGLQDEKFVVSAQKFQEQYIEKDGRYYTREKHIVVVKNPYNTPIQIRAPWSTEAVPVIEKGNEECFLTVVIDENGQYSNDRYLIGNEELLFSNYEFERKSLDELLTDAEKALQRKGASELRVTENAFAVLLDWQKAAEREAERTKKSSYIDVILTRAELFFRVNRITFATHDLVDAELAANNDLTVSQELLERIERLRTQLMKK